MNIKTRQSIERKIAQAAAQGLIDAGYSVSVFDGEEVAQAATTDIKKIMAALFTTDEDCLVAYINDWRVGAVMLVYGNDGWDVMADYNVKLETALEGANKLAKQYEEQYG